MTQIWTDQLAGPASYSGGIVVTTDLASVAFFSAEIDNPAALESVEFRYELNTPSAGQVRVRLRRATYQQPTAVGNMSGLPSGVTARGTSGGTYSGVGHVHTGSHDHAPTGASDPPASGGTGTIVLAATPNMSTHTHTVDFPSGGTSLVSESAHTHTWNTIYEHQHGITNTTTAVDRTELSGTDLSGVSFTYLATD